MKCRMKKFADPYIFPRRKVAGFTLLELLLAVSIVSVVLLAAGSLLVGETRNAARNRRVVDMQRAGSLAMKVIGRKIREAYLDDGEVSESGNKIIYFESSNENYVEWKESEGLLVLEPDGVNLIDSQWEIRDFYVKKVDLGSAWQVVLEIRVPGTTSDFVLDSNFIPRNSIPDTE